MFVYYSPTALLKESQFGKVYTALVHRRLDLKRPWPAMPGVNKVKKTART